jgi:hypothetical protein
LDHLLCFGQRQWAKDYRVGQARLAKRGEDATERMQPVELIGSIARHEKHVSLAKGTGQVGEQVHRRFVRPLEVIDRQHEGFLSSEIAEDACEGPEGAIPDVGIRDGEVALPLDEPWHVAHTAKRIDEWPEWATGLRLDAMAHENSRTRRPGATEEGIEQATLPDPGIASNERDPSAPRDHLREDRFERRELSFTSDEDWAKHS